MKKILCTVGLVASLLATAGACGGGDGTSDGGAGMGGSSGGSTAGTPSQAGGGATGAGTGGSSAGMQSGGTSGSGTSGSNAGGGSDGGGGSTAGGSGSTAMCAPGMTYKGASAYPDPLQNCGFTGKGELAGVDAYFASIKLPEPIGPGDSFSFSVDVNKLGQGTMELWGGTGECGEAHEKLATVSVPAGNGGNRCMTAKPMKGTYPYLIWVMNVAGAHGDVTLCPDVSCP